MEPASGLHIIWDRERNGAFHEAVYKCPECKRLNLAFEWFGQDNTGGSTVSTPDVAERAAWHSPSWLPRYQEVREFEHVPGHIALAASEATLCLSVGAYRAVGALTRAVIEATAKDKAAAGKNLEARIDALRHADHIRTHTQEQAHEVRHFGNDMAHGDFADPVSKEEAEEVVELMAEILDEVYQSPARLQQLKDARLAKKGQGLA
jgi:hypothetical protein